MGVRYRAVRILAVLAGATNTLSRMVTSDDDVSDGGEGGMGLMSATVTQRPSLFMC